MLLLLIACRGVGSGSTPEEALLDASKEVTFGTVKDLGSHRMQALITRSVTPTGGAALVTEEQVTLAWQDERTWSYQATRDGKVRNEVVVFDGAPWRRTGGRWERAEDAQSWEVQLASVWDPWRLAFESLESSLRLVPETLDEIEGRRAWKQRVEVIPAPQGRRRKPWTATVAEGSVWLDEATALRLVGDVHVVAEAPGKSMDITLRFATSGIGMDARVRAPRDDVP